MCFLIVCVDTEAEMKETLAKKRVRHVSVKKLQTESFDDSMVTLKKENKKKVQVCFLYSV